MSEGLSAYNHCIHELLEVQTALTPDATAVEYRGSRLTYRQLNERANQLAHVLRSYGAGPEVIVGIGLKRSLELPCFSVPTEQRTSPALTSRSTAAGRRPSA